MISVPCVGKRLVWGLLASYIWNLIPTVGNRYGGHLFKLLVSGGHSHCRWIFTHKLCEIGSSHQWRLHLCRNHGTWKQDSFSFQLDSVQLPAANMSASSFCTIIYHSSGNEGLGNSIWWQTFFFLENNCSKKEMGSTEGNWHFYSLEGGLVAPYFVNPDVRPGDRAMLLT